LGDCFVQLLYDFTSFLPHFLDLILDEGKDLVLMILEPASDVVVDRIDNMVYPLEVRADGFLGLFEGGLAMGEILDVGEEAFSDGIFDESVEGGETLPADGWEILLDDCIPQVAHR
jgi:hypothetical protein